MDRVMDGFLGQDIGELTEMLHFSEEMEDLRGALRRDGLVPEELLLVGFKEGEGERETGALVDMSGGIFEYERSLAAGFVSFRPLEDVAQAIQLYPGVCLALQLLGQARGRTPKPSASH